MEQYGLIVIGAGPGGYEAALRASKLGIRTALVESRDVGGTCLNRGCIPTKSLLHAAQIVKEASGGGEWGVNAGELAVDFAAVHRKKAEAPAAPPAPPQPTAEEKLLAEIRDLLKERADG